MSGLGVRLGRSDELHQQVQQAIASSRGDRLWAWPDTDFDQLSLALFEQQFASCPPYRHYCEGRSVSPETIGAWTEIPPVPAEVFKTVDLFAFPAEEARVTFLTSGTRLGTRGRHHLRRTDTYVASLSSWFDAFVLPDGLERRVLVLAPEAARDPHSSLSFMLQWVLDERGGAGSRCLWSEVGPDFDGCIRSMTSAQASGEAILLLGTARVLQALLEWPLPPGSSHALPAGSVVMETGGPKRSGMPFDRGSFHRELAEWFSLPIEAIVSEYGMTEMGSQGYQPGWRGSSEPSVALRVPGGDPDLHVFPPWCRVQALDPDSLEQLPGGERGLLCYWDLSNVDSVLSVLTSDEGVVLPEGVRLLGRSAQASPRGCSLAVDAILRGTGG